MKPLPEKKPINKDIITCEKLFRQFKNTGKLDDPEASAPWPDLVQKEGLKKFIKAQKEKNANTATAHSFYYVFRKNEEILQNDVQF